MTEEAAASVCQQRLEGWLASRGRVAVAFSGGVDSSYLLAVAKRVLGDDVVAITVASALNPQREAVEAAQLCSQLGARQIVLSLDPLAVPEVAANPADRCYHCKRAIFDAIWARAKEEGFDVLADGSNVDDLSDYRPGARAVAELGVASPLREAGFTKDLIREASAVMGLPTWNKPSFACLASRFPYGQPLTAEGLRQVEQAEQLLMDAGFAQVRVRSHGSLARIEAAPERQDELYARLRAGDLTSRLHELGFSYVTLDLDGYRTGSMNDVLPPMGGDL